MRNKGKRGFTLVELSIVLVIIGLLIGGILVAQSMIGTARIQAQVRQLGQFDVAVANFRTRFNALPGDNTLLGNTGVTVNGKIYASGASWGKFDGEIARFWYDLSLNGLVNPTGNAYVDASAGQNINPGVNIPKAIAGQGGTIMAVNWFPGAGVNHYYIMNWAGGATPSSITWTPALTTAEGLAIDKKIDDGGINSGQVKGDPNGVPTGSGCMGYDGVNNFYDLAIPGYVCGLWVRIGIGTGNLE